MQQPVLLYHQDQVHAAACSALPSGSCSSLFCSTIRFMQQPVLLYYQVHAAACSALPSSSCSSLFSGSWSSLLCSDSCSSLFCTTMRFMQQPVLLYHPLMHQPALLHSRVTAGAYSALPSGSCHNLFRSITGVMPPSCHVICLPCFPATMWVVGPLLTVPLGHTWSGHGGVGL